ncbi:Putative transposase fragment [Mycobacterium canettii CIPT 140070010]|nr:Putative transposase fragment [Mycobacterium canettii CIPT 140070010]
MATWAGIACVCFSTDVFCRMIVGWRVASHMRTTMVLDVNRPGNGPLVERNARPTSGWASSRLVICTTA